jgi:hypothetical protein
LESDIRRKLFKLGKSAEKDKLSLRVIKGEFIVKEPGLNVGETELKMQKVLLKIRRRKGGENLSVISIRMVR